MAAPSGPQDEDPDFSIRAVTESDVRDFATWHYDPPYDGYTITQPIDEAVAYFLQPATNCHVILAGGELAAFFTFGSDARVPGGDYAKPLLDIGLGVRPSLTGQGRGRHFVAAVVRYAGQEYPDEPLRVTIAAANRRAIRVWSDAGFFQTQEFTSSETVMGSDTFLIFERLE